MELLGTLFRGPVIGFSIAAPVGPIGVLCIRRTLLSGSSAGLLYGLGAASADAAYGCVAAFGLASVSGFLVDQQLWLRLLGGAFLLYLGLRTFREQPAGQEIITREVSYGGLMETYASTFFLTITNPLTVLSFVAIFRIGLGR